MASIRLRSAATSADAPPKPARSRATIAGNSRSASFAIRAHFATMLYQAIVGS